MSAVSALRLRPVAVSWTNRSWLPPVLLAAVVLVGTALVARYGLRMHGVGGPAVYAVVTLSGWAAGWRTVGLRRLVGKA